MILHLSAFSTNLSLSLSLSPVLFPSHHQWNHHQSYLAARLQRPLKSPRLQTEPHFAPLTRLCFCDTHTLLLFSPTTPQSSPVQWYTCLYATCKLEMHVMLALIVSLSLPTFTRSRVCTLCPAVPQLFFRFYLYLSQFILLYRTVFSSLLPFPPHSYQSFINCNRYLHLYTFLYFNNSCNTHRHTVNFVARCAF